MKAAKAKLSSEYPMSQPEERKTLSYESCLARGYEINERIGQGGFGMVFRASQPAVGRQVAVKMILPHYAAEDEFVTRFDEEAKLVARLEHPHIVPLYDYWREAEGAYLVMRWLNGGNLYASLQEQPWDILAAADLLDQIAGALSSAHRNNVIHRDVKPENIMLDETGNAYLTDFGIAKDLIEGTSRTNPGVVMGSLLYIAPEQVQGEPASSLSDLYSLGIVMYELLTGEHPFSKSGKASQIAKILSEPTPHLPDILPGLPEDLDAVIQQVTAKKPEERFADAQAFAAAFRSAVTGVRLEARVAPPALPRIRHELPAFLDEEAEVISQVVERPVFVARQAELDQLGNFLDTALQGKGRVVFVTGGPGRGKTALVDEFSRRAMEAHPDLLVAWGTCNAYSGFGDPYLPFREVLGTLTGDVESHWAAGRYSTGHARRTWDSIPLAIQTLLEHGPHLPDIFLNKKTLLSRVTSSITDDVPWVRELRAELDSSPEHTQGLEQGHIFEQYSNVLRALSHTRPLLLILDDMQWADTASAGLLFHLGRRLEGAAILLVCTYRPEEVAIGRTSTQISLDQLERHPMEKILAEFKRLYGDVWIDLSGVDNKESRGFVDEILDCEPNQLEEMFRKALYNHTGGHPLFTIELLRAMQERGDLVQKDGNWVQGPALDWDTLPAKVEGVIEERIGRLDEELYEILSVASVEGMSFTAQVVAKVLEFGERNLLRQLSRDLEGRHRLVHEQDDVNVGRHWLARYRFMHAMVHQHLYRQISQGERRWLHTSIGEILEDFYAGHVEEIAVQLARHFAGDPEREGKYLRIAGFQAAQRFANEEALRLFERALNFLPENDIENRFEILLAREAVFNILGQRAAQRKDLEELSQLVELPDTPELVSRKAEVVTRWAIYTGNTDNVEAASLAEKAISHAQEEKRPDVAVEAYSIWAEVLRKQGDLSEAANQAQVGLTLAQEIDDRAGESGLLNTLGLLTLDQHKKQKAVEYFEHSLGIAREIGDRQRVARNLNNLAITFGNSGDFFSARDYYGQALQIAREIGDRRGEALVLGNLGWVASIQGDYVTAAAHYEQNLDIARNIEDRYLEAYAAINLCMASMLQGQYGLAMKHAKQGRSIARETGDRSGEAWSLTFLGHVCLEMGHPREAEASYRNALEIRRELGQQNLAMEPLAGLARQALVHGEIPIAQKYMDEILKYFDEGGTLEGTEEPLRVWLTCYQVLVAVSDPRAEDTLATMNKKLHIRAAEINDEALRRSFLERVPHHAEIIKALEESQKP